MIKVTIYTPAELAQSSYVHTGLFELQKENYLKCKVKLRLKKDLGTLHIKNGKIDYSKRPQPKTSFYDIKKENKKIVKIAIDLYDDPSKFSIPALKKCDYIFKRNFQKKYIEKLPKKYSKKIFSFGLTAPCITKYRHSTLKIYIGLITYLFLVNIKFDRLFFSRFVTVFNSFKSNYLFNKKNRDIETLRSVHPSTKNHVLFQTRCFENISSLDVNKINYERNKIISLLKNELKLKFKGGFTKSKFANKYYKHNISKISSDPSLYFNELNASQIVVYTKGLLTSPAWKMAEYLSKGKVILAERLLTDLPFKLENNKHLLYFNNSKDCAKKAKEILSNHRTIEKLSKNSRDYYNKYVDPPRNIKRIIEFIR